MCTKVMFYKIYGLIVKSSIELTNCIKLDNSYNEDIIIKEGKVPNFAKEYEYTNKYMYFSIRNVAKYYISDGKVIIVEKDEKSNSANVLSYLIGSALGMAMIQRAIIPLHGGAVLVDGKRICILGKSGMGKSSLVMGLVEDGNKLIADDVSSIKVKDNSIYLCTAYPSQKICSDTAKIFGYDTRKLQLLNEDRQKYLLARNKDFCFEDGIINVLFELNEYDGKLVKIEEVKGKEKLMVVFRNIYRGLVFDYIDMKPEFIRNCLSIVKSVQVYRLFRPKNSFCVDEQIKNIYQILEVSHDK